MYFLSMPECACELGMCMGASKCACAMCMYKAKMMIILWMKRTNKRFKISKEFIKLSQHHGLKYWPILIPIDSYVPLPNWYFDRYWGWCGLVLGLVRGGGGCCALSLSSRRPYFIFSNLIFHHFWVKSQALRRSHCNLVTLGNILSLFFIFF